MFINSLRIGFAGLMISAVAAWAAPVGPATLQGDVKDSKLQPVAGAEVHIQAKDGSGLQKIIRTDSTGNFGVSNLPITDYEVVLFVNGQIKATLTNQHVFGNKPTQTDFKLTGKYAANAQKKHTHMVYMPPDIDSHIGGGRWVEVDDKGNIVGSTGASNIQKVTGTAVQQSQFNPHAVSPGH